MRKLSSVAAISPQDHRSMRIARNFACGLVAFLGLVSARADDDLGLRVAPGFRVSLYADQDLADDIYAMTLDARGRVVVTGQGYVSRLEDSQGRGRADRA